MDSGTLEQNVTAIGAHTLSSVRCCETPFRIGLTLSGMRWFSVVIWMHSNPATSSYVHWRGSDKITFFITSSSTTRWWQPFISSWLPSLSGYVGTIADIDLRWWRFLQMRCIDRDTIKLPSFLVWIRTNKKRIPHLWPANPQCFFLRNPRLKNLKQFVYIRLIIKWSPLCLQPGDPISLRIGSLKRQKTTPSCIHHILLSGLASAASNQDKTVQMLRFCCYCRFLKRRGWWKWEKVTPKLDLDFEVLLSGNVFKPPNCCPVIVR